MFVVVCNVPVEREHYLRVLDETLPGLRIQRARLTEETLDPLAETLAQTTPGPGTAIALLDVERAVPSSEPYHPMLENFNLQRQRWVEHVPCPVMMWVPEYVVPYLNREAPDFMDRRSGLLVLPSANVLELLHMQPSAWDAGGAFTIEQRERRIVELRARLAANTGSDDRATWAACRAWAEELGSHLHHFGRYDEARAAHERALRLARQLGDSEGEVETQVSLGTLSLSQGATAQAEDHLRLAQEHVVSDKATAASRHRALGEWAALRGDYERAARELGQAMTLAADVNRLDLIARAYADAGRVLAAGPSDSVQKGIAASLRSIEQLVPALTQFQDALAERSQPLERSLRTANDFARRANLEATAAAVTADLAVLQANRGDLVAAQAAFEQAYKQAQAAGVVTLVRQMQQQLDQLQAAFGPISAPRTKP